MPSGRTTSRLGSTIRWAHIAQPLWPNNNNLTTNAEVNSKMVRSKFFISEQGVCVTRSRGAEMAAKSGEESAEK